MNIKILSIGLGIIGVSNLFMLLFINILNLRSFASMLLFTVIALVSWIVLLKKDVSIEFKISNSEIFKNTSLLLIIPLLAIGYFLNIAEDIQYGLLSLMLITSLATGIYEEIIFRGIGLGSFISSGIKPSRAILLSATLFSLFHLYAVHNDGSFDIILKMLNTFMMGTILGYIYYATKNILYVMVIHFIWDFESFLAKGYILDNIGTAISIILFSMTILYFSWSMKKVIR